MSTKTRFEEEAKGNSEIACCCSIHVHEYYFMSFGNNKTVYGKKQEISFHLYWASSVTIKRLRLGSITSLQKQAKNSLLGPVQIPLGMPKHKMTPLLWESYLVYTRTDVIGHQVMQCQSCTCKHFQRTAVKNQNFLLHDPSVYDVQEQKRTKQKNTKNPPILTYITRWFPRNIRAIMAKIKLPKKAL